MTIEIDTVSAWYGDVIALNDVTATLDEPLIGLLGPNGAGKSTLLALISGLRSPNAGEIRVNGRTPRNDPTVLGTIGLVPEPLAPPHWLTGRRFVVDLARMNGMNRWKAENEGRQILARLGLAAAMDRPIRGYSQGMRQRVKLAQALIHQPGLLLLDEPFTGLDPPGRAMMSRAIREAADNGTQVIFSSHVLAEVEAVTRDVIMLLRGRMVAQGTVREVRAALTDVPLKIGLQTNEPRAVAKRVLELGGVEGLLIKPREVVVEVAHGTSFFRELTKHGADMPLTGFAPVDEDIESVYNLLLDRRGKRQ